MENHRLQILLLPPGTEAFGGIGTYQGIPKEALDELFKIANFQYMGNSEYEFGAIPKSLHEICSHRPAYALHKAEVKNTNFYFLIPEEKLGSYTRLMEDWTTRNHYDEYHGLLDVVSGKNERNIQGWLDLKDHVMFFINEDMAKKMGEFLRYE